MFLRILMIGLVSSLGLDAGLWNDLGRNVHARCTWCAARHQEETAWAGAPDEGNRPCAAAAVEADPMPTGEEAFASEAAPVPVVSQSETPAPAPAASDPTPAPVLVDLPAVAEAAPAIEVVETPAPAVLESPLSTETVSHPEAAFEAMVDQMVVHYAQEMSAPAAPAAPQPMLAETEPSLPPVAESVGVPSPAEIFDSLFGLDPEMAVVEADAIPTAPASEVAPRPRAERLATAVRLTGQAFHAWLSLIQTPSVALESDASAFSR